MAYIRPAEWGEGVTVPGVWGLEELTWAGEIGVPQATASIFGIAIVVADGDWIGRTDVCGPEEDPIPDLSAWDLCSVVEDAVPDLSALDICPALGDPIPDLSGEDCPEVTA